MSQTYTYIIIFMWCSVLLPRTSAFVLKKGHHHGQTAVRRYWRSVTTSLADSSTPTTTTTTQYTIDCPPVDPEALRKVVNKHAVNLDRFLQQKPAAAHTRAAFEQLNQCIQLKKCNNLILDSGCGTGRSSLVLGEKYPESTIIGIDRSVARLRKNPFVPVNRRADRSTATTTNELLSNDSAHDTPDDTHETVVQQVAENVWLVRAELVDFWRCLLENNCSVEQHYMLYPNPYPKLSRLKHRWYAHPSFPLLLHLSGSKLVLRSNWKLYLQEFETAVSILADTDFSSSVLPSNPAAAFSMSAHGKSNVLQRSSDEPGWTNFEEKYRIAGEATFELVYEKEQPAD